MFYLFHVFRSFLPSHNPIGFGAGDFVEFLVAFALVLLVLAREPSRSGRAASRRETAWSMLALARARPSRCAWRCCRRPARPSPAPPTITATCCWPILLSHFRLANPRIPFTVSSRATSCCSSPPTARFFRMGQGIALALGRAIFGHPWAGVLLTEAAPVRAVLLDAARLGLRRVGSGGRTPRGLRARPADLLDELLLGRSGFRNRRLPGVRGACRDLCETRGSAPATRSCSAQRPRTGVAHAPVRMRVPGRDRGALLSCCRRWRN